jgi:hypothetical protein
MKITKKNGKLVITASAEELRKNPKFAAAMKKAQMAAPAVASPAPAAPAGAPAGGPMKPLEAPGGEPTLDGIDDLGSGGGASPDLGGLSEPAAPGEVSDELGGADPLTDGVSDELGGDPSEKFTSGVEKAFQDAFGKPLDEGMKQVLNGLAQMAQGGSTPAVDDLDATGGEIPGGDKDPLAGDGMEVDPASDPDAQGSGVGAPGGAPNAGDPMAGGAGGSDLLAKSRGRLTKVASTSDWVAKLAAKLAK